MALCFSLIATITSTYALLPENKAIIDGLNSESYSAVFRVNEFENMTQSEFKATRLMNLDPTQMLKTLRSMKHHQSSLSSMPSSWDWRDHDAVTPVKNQESCGTCWAFSTTGNIEGQWTLSSSSNELTSLSEEFLVDCDNRDCGMFGGWPYDGYQFIIDQMGIPSEESYPYCCGTKETCYPCMPQGYNRTMCGNHDDLYCNKTWDSSHCPASDWKSAATIKDWMPISTNETEIAMSLVEIGPLSVCMNAASLTYYRGGVYDPNHCDPADLDHAVLIVGYGTDNTITPAMDYWIVKNSWGQSWGEDGYFRIVRGVGKCGINTAVTTSCINGCQT